jgi:hypothetical protein
MRHKLLLASLFAATTMMTVAGCSSNQEVKTTDGSTIVTDGKPKVWSLIKMPKPVRPSRLTVTS